MDKERKPVVKNKGGRPRLELDERQIFELAKINCTMKEIADVMDCSVSTLEKSFSGLINKGKASGKTTIRRAMWKAGIKGNVTMLIWLSKNLLGMHEPQVVEVVREEAKGTFNEFYNTTTKA